jgi:hypothetical protein
VSERETTKKIEAGTVKVFWFSRFHLPPSNGPNVCSIFRAYVGEERLRISICDIFEATQAAEIFISEPFSSPRTIFILFCI